MKKFKEVTNGDIVYLVKYVDVKRTKISKIYIGKVYDIQINEVSKNLEILVSAVDEKILDSCKFFWKTEYEIFIMESKHLNSVKATCLKYKHVDYFSCIEALLIASLRYKFNLQDL